MKLASLRNGRPDGQLVVVSRDLQRYVSAGKIAPNLQSALDEWARAAPQLEALSQQLNDGEIVGQPFDAELALAPLPRAYQWIDGSGYLGHLERVRSLKGSQDAGLETKKVLLYQGASDSFSAARDPIVVPQADLAIDYEAEIAVITGPVPMGCSTAEAAGAVRLITLCNDVSLRRLVAEDLQDGFGFFHAKPSTSFAPVVATPDELGDLWYDNKLNATVEVFVNDTPYARLNAGEGVSFDAAEMIAAATRTRDLGTGTIIGLGTIANAHDEILPLKRGDRGFGCIAEARTLEKATSGTASTPFLALGDIVRIVAHHDGHDLFGAIKQAVEVTAPA